MANSPSSERETPRSSGSNNPGNQPIANHILGDEPAGTAVDDRLGFTPYVAAVAEFLTDSSTKIPLTLSVEGLWGSGKSSFMLQLQEALRNRGQTRIVSFNAWQYNADESLWAAFIHEFDSKLDGSLNWEERLLARWRLLRLRVSWQDSLDTIKTLVWLTATLFAGSAIVWFLSHGGFAVLQDHIRDSGKVNEAASKTIAKVGGAGGAAAVLLLLFSQLRDLFKSPASLSKTAHLLAKPNYSARLPLIYEVSRDFKSLVSAYVKDGNVYVFIDDLDRCEYSKAAELMQALLMLLSSAPKIALIIGLDREKVAAALAAKQEKLLPYLYRVQPAQAYEHGMEYGQRFIEKFIQLSYILPAAQSSGLKAMINPDVPPVRESVPESQKSASAIELVTGKNDSKTLSRLIDMAAEVFEQNPRNIKQFINMFRLQAFIANETGLFGTQRTIRTDGEPLTIQQLGKFVALCMRWPLFVEAAGEDAELVVNLESLVLSESQPRDSSNLAVWIQDKYLMMLLAFETGRKEFSLAGLDFRKLTEISPARAKRKIERETFADQPAEPTEGPPSPRFKSERPISSQRPPK